VGVLALWYPILTDAPHAAMLGKLVSVFPEGLRHEVRFPPVRTGHRMTGSGMFVVNPPWGTADAAADIERLMAALPQRGQDGARGRSVKPGGGDDHRWSLSASARRMRPVAPQM
jgi:23S rRNA A2030 N6-methylase RlmJ